MIKLMMEQRSEAWHDARIGRITGTAFKEVVSAKSTVGYNTLIVEKAGEIITGIAESNDYVSADMERGIELEPFAVSEYESLFSVSGYDCGLVIPDEDNEFHEWIGVSPDRMFDGYGLEIKCPKMKTHLNYIESGKLPNEYKWQVQGQLFVTGFEYWDFMSYYPNMKPFIIRVYPDVNMFAVLETALRQAIIDIKNKIKIYNQYEYL